MPPTLDRKEPIPLSRAGTGIAIALWIAAIVAAIWLAAIVATAAQQEQRQQGDVYDAGYRCSPTCFVTDEAAEPRLQACLACLQHIEQRGHICGIEKRCP